jgi:effector-binding domain-containing protein
MKAEIINKNFTADLYGFSGIAIGQDFAGTGFKLMDRMWKIVKSNNLKNKGINIWVYESQNKMFAGVELESVPPDNLGLEHKVVHLTKYAYHKHIGSYKLLKQAGQDINDELKSRGIQTDLPYIEMYGHWTNDESKLETEILVAVK